MKVGIVHFMAYPEVQRGDNVIESIQTIAEDAFFGAIEITSIKDPDTRARAARLLGAAHMAVGYGAQPIQLGGKLDLSNPDPEQRKSVVQRLKEAIDEAAELGAQRFAVLSGPYPGP